MSAVDVPRVDGRLWLNLLIRHKLFLVIFFANILVAIAIFTTIGWNFSRGFREYVRNDMIQRLEPLNKALAAEYEKNNLSWAWVDQDDVAWQQFLIDYGVITLPQRLIESGKPMPELVEHDSLKQQLRIKGLSRQERHRIQNELNQRFKYQQQLNATGVIRGRALEHFYVRDAEGYLVVGRGKNPLNRYVWIPVVLEGETVGDLGFPQDERFTRDLDRHFVEGLLKQSAWIIVFIMLISACLALPLSHRVVRPITDLKSAMQKLASGKIRDIGHLQVKGGDELTQLAISFNLLAGTLNSHLSARQQWVADISHELRTPVAVLRGELEALIEGVRPRTSDAIGSLHEEIMRLTRLIDDLYQLSLSDLGALNYQRCCLSINQLINEVLFHSELKLTEHRLKLQIDEQGQFNIFGDSDRLTQLFRNILSNTIRYTASGGEIRVQIKEDPESDQQIIVSWEDSAPGVDDDDLKHLFERLYRSDQARDRVSGGSGLGLAISQAIVEAHQGTIMAYHSKLGGLAIRIVLPKYKAEME